VTSAEEARLWAGIAEWPVSSDTLANWHVAADVLPFLLALDDDATPVAYGEVWLDAEEDEAELARLLVDPAVRGRGHGRRLVALLTVEARRLGFAEVWLRVRPENAPAIACYRGAGFIRASAADEAAFNIGQPCEYLWMRAAA
jgi:ribosomal protein S18 acetylase RimI-like enzyme